MRIISGKYRGKRLHAPKNLPVRPTTDMAKEALFNILTNRYYLEDISVIDLFSGTGNISFEFASRGVENIVAVDQHPGCTKYVLKMARELDLPISVVKSDGFKYLKQRNDKADVIFADPPYGFDVNELKKVSELVFEKDLLEENGLLIIEHTPQNNLSDSNHFSESRKYGSSVFSFFEK